MTDANERTFKFCIYNKNKNRLFLYCQVKNEFHLSTTQLRTQTARFFTCDREYGFYNVC